MIGWSFAKMSSFMPVDKLHETELVMAFHHPKPQHKTHILIVPKRALRSLMALKDEDMAVVNDVFRTAQKLVEKLQLEEGGFRLTVNGGAYQDVMQIHWHLTADV